jgi:TRAP-type C4-dicarboxylate transport system permease large subunit
MKFVANVVGAIVAIVTFFITLRIYNFIAGRKRPRKSSFKRFEIALFKFSMASMAAYIAFRLIIGLFDGSR